MANRIFKLLIGDSIISTQVRFKYTRGKSPTVAKTLKQRIAELEYKDPAVYYKVDIGFPVPKNISSDLRKAWIKEVSERRNDPNLEKKVLRNQLTIDLERVKADWLEGNAPHHMHRIAKHYGIFDDLYEDGYFYPIVPLSIDYDFGHEELLAKVYSGNIISSSKAENAPQVRFEAEPNTLWTLLLTTPDCNFTDPGNEYCHWFIGNIPGNDVGKGEQIIDYLRPIPPKGIGHCRYVFVLYKQDKKIDFSEYKKEQPCLNLAERDWKTYDFMRKYQDYLTPAGLAFFQSDYDSTVKDFYHNSLKMELPIFEYDFPAPYMRSQQWFPKKRAFNTYMDRYRDPKQIAKEFLLKRLKKEHPFKFPDPPLKYPNAHPFKGYQPSWLRTEMKKERLGWGYVKEYSE